MLGYGGILAVANLRSPPCVHFDGQECKAFCIKITICYFACFCGICLLAGGVFEAQALVLHVPSTVDSSHEGTRPFNKESDTTQSHANQHCL